MTQAARTCRHDPLDPEFIKRYSSKTYVAKYPHRTGRTKKG